MFISGAVSASISQQILISYLTTWTTSHATLLAVRHAFAYSALVSAKKGEKPCSVPNVAARTVTAPSVVASTITSSALWDCVPGAASPASVVSMLLSSLSHFSVTSTAGAAVILISSEFPGTSWKSGTQCFSVSRMFRPIVARHAATVFSLCCRFIASAP
jgi:hypothetical protein